MSGMMLHGLGDCTPELNCGCMAKSPRDVLRERIARAIHANDYVRGLCDLGWGESHVNREAYRANADAVIEALGLTEQREQGYTVAFNDDERALHWAPRRRYVTPWERIEEDG